MSLGPLGGTFERLAFPSLPASTRGHQRATQRRSPGERAAGQINSGECESCTSDGEGRARRGRL